MLSTSLKGGTDDIFSYPPEFIPKSFHWENYSKVLSMYPWGQFLKNTCLITFISMGATLLSSSMVAFAFARLRFPGREKLFWLVLATMMVPVSYTHLPYDWQNWFVMGGGDYLSPDCLLYTSTGARARRKDSAAS